VFLDLITSEREYILKLDRLVEVRLIEQLVVRVWR